MVWRSDFKTWVQFFLTFYLFCVWVRVHMHVCACATHMCLSVYMAPRTFYGFFFSTVCNPGGQTCLSGLATSSYTYRTVSLAWVHLMIICLFRLSVSFVFILLFSLLCQDWAEWSWIPSVSQAGLKPVITLPSASGVLRLQKCVTTPCSIFLFTSESVLIDVLV